MQRVPTHTTLPLWNEKSEEQKGEYFDILYFDLLEYLKNKKIDSLSLERYRAGTDPNKHREYILDEYRDMLSTETNNLLDRIIRSRQSI